MQLVKAQDVPLVTDWLGSISTLVQAIVVIIAAVYALIQIREARSARRATVALHLFDQLNLEAAITRRRRLYAKFARRMSRLSPSEDREIGRIANEFTQLGFLVREGLVDERLAITLYYGAILRCGEILMPWVRQQRRAREDEFYADDFEDLYLRTLEFKRKYRSGVRGW